ncbi:hypothetical protein BV509_16295 [Rhodovulum sulfidophilum]|uniref:Uncharacterized protein n=1 Tax=Rhodovulum visakhapatnamense TaxID=364297 RepID=A0ABS1REK4_9RHOB|nr:hypothetical protein [Rhodovulum visakhapatnamense]MBL3568680.1 hypothetical protein [Rhodovulum visakhapatnamense]MBL3577201.1 hypothetical protein [Rhodovulum visakhapatnamense]OLS45755.1 hypothetical protein BV509_16295 [Rhodovulum sulfidophilum]
MTDRHGLMTDTPTPLSSRFGWPLLSNRKPDVELGKVRDHPLSDALNLPLLSERQGSSTKLMTDMPTPFSSRFGWPLLSGRRSDLKLMTDNPTPFSAALGLPLLSASETDTGAAPKTGGARNMSWRTGQGSGSDGPVAKFIRQVITGEVQK